MGRATLYIDPSALERIHDGILFLNKKWEIVYLNRALKKFLRLSTSNKNLIGKNIIEMYPQIKKLPEFKTFKQIFKHNRATTFELKSPISGQWRKATCYPNEDGLSIIVQDIAKEKEIEEQLKAEKDWSESILESIQDGFIVIDYSLRYLYLNKKAEEIIGISKNKLIGKKFPEVFPDHNIDLGTLLQVVKKALFEKKPATLDLYFRPLRKWFFLMVYPFGNKFSVIFKDITEEKKIKDELKNLKKQLDVVFKNVSDGIIIQKKDAKVIYANESAAKATGYSSGEKMIEAPKNSYKNRFILFDQQKQPLSWENLPGRLVLAGKKEADEKIVCFQDKKTKTEAWVEAKATKIPFFDGQGFCVITILHDITILKQLEQQKDDFISLVSHELKTPLTSTKVYLEVLQKKYSGNEKTDKIIEKVSRNINKLTELVYSLLDVTRTQEGKLGLHKRNFLLTDLLQEVVEDIQPITDHAVILKNGQSISVYADRERLAQVIINLIMNAIKYSKHAKKILIRSFIKNNKIVVYVRDYGIGIPQKDQKEVFKRFFQSDKHNTFPGLGLGLYISSEIIKAHDGKIWVESREGKGSTFYFSLPE